MKDKAWDSVQELFQAISGEEYVVLRNFANLKAEVVSGPHPDIDFLCRSTQPLKQAMHLSHRGKLPDDVHFKTSVAGREVAVDLRHVGDGYLDAAWEDHILTHRVLFDSLCYVPCEEDFRYSLLYHAVIQKEKMSPDYRQILKDQFGDRLSKEDRTEYVALLEEYLRAMRYRYSWPSSPRTVFHTKDCSGDLVENRPGRRLLHTFAGSIAKVLTK